MIIINSLLCAHWKNHNCVLLLAEAAGCTDRTNGGCNDICVQSSCLWSCKCSQEGYQIHPDCRTCPGLCFCIVLTVKHKYGHPFTGTNGILGGKCLQIWNCTRSSRTHVQQNALKYNLLFCYFADIDECVNITESECKGACINTPGSYMCLEPCIKGYVWDVNNQTCSGTSIT